MVEGFKKNEEQLKHYVSEYKTKLKNQDQVFCFSVYTYLINGNIPGFLTVSLLLTLL